MRVLAIDTTEAACSAALLCDGEVRERFEIAPRRHSELILPMMQALLQEAGLSLTQLHALAFARGPGSFTGVRIASSVVQACALGADLPVLPVSSLLALAQGAYRESAVPRVLAGLDARMQEVYWAACVCEQGVMTLQDGEQVCAPEQVPLPDGEAWLGVGGAFAAYEQVLKERLGNGLGDVLGQAQIHACDLLPLAERAYRQGAGVPAELALPVYLRDQVAQKPKA